MAKFKNMHPLHQLINSLCSITEKEWLMFYRHAETINLRKGSNYIKEGSKEKRIGFIIKGAFRQYYTRQNGDEVTTYFYFENNLVSSYLSCITNTSSLLTIEALEATTMLVFPYAVLSKLFDDEKSWERFGRKIAEYLAVGLEERMVGLLMDKPEERYLKFLNSSNKKKILERVPQHYIANYLGITAISLSRIRSRIQKNK